MSQALIMRDRSIAVTQTEREAATKVLEQSIRGVDEKNLISFDRLHELLSYDQNTGIFTWLIPTGRRVKVGDIAGHIDNDSYCRIKIEGHLYLAHRLAWVLYHRHLAKNND